MHVRSPEAARLGRPDATSRSRRPRPRLRATRRRPAPAAPHRDGSRGGPEGPRMHRPADAWSATVAAEGESAGGVRLRGVRRAAGRRACQAGVRSVERGASPEASPCPASPRRRSLPARAARPVPRDPRSGLGDASPRQRNRETRRSTGGRLKRSSAAVHLQDVASRKRRDADMGLRQLLVERLVGAQLENRLVAEVEMSRSPWSGRSSRPRRLRARLLRSRAGRSAREAHGTKLRHGCDPAAKEILKQEVT